MAAQRYTRLDVVGEGTYGRVYKARSTVNGELVAIKRLFTSQEEEGVSATTIREIAILKQLRHPNIIQLKDVLFHLPKLTLVFELCESDLKKHMTARSGYLDAEAVKAFTMQLLRGIACLHSSGIVHRDLKPQNVLINEETKTLKICDFGLARVEGIPVKKYSHEAVTLWYRAPDVILGSANYGLAVDMWSAGCIFGEMLTGEALFQGRGEAEQLQRIFRFIGRPTREKLATYPDFPKYQSHPFNEEVIENPSIDAWWTGTRAENLGGPLALDLLKKMLTFDPKQRITAAEAVNHPYFEATPQHESPSQQQIAAVLPPVMSPRTSPSGSPSRGPTNIIDGGLGHPSEPMMAKPPELAVEALVQ